MIERTTDEDPEVVRRRAERLVRDLYAPLTRSSIVYGIALMLAAGLGTAIGVALDEPIWAAVTAAAIGLTGTLAAWSWLLDRSAREGAELVWDHNCREMAQWKAETGSRYPRSVAAARAWLDAHPGAPGTASILLRLGRLAEADIAIAAATARTPEEAFSLDILRETRVLFAGGRPDLVELHAKWLSLPDGPERRHRRECLALLDADTAVVDGRDPWMVLAVARAEVGDVDPSMRASRSLGRMVAFVLIAAVVAAAVTLATVAAGI